MIKYIAAALMVLMIPTTDAKPRKKKLPIAALVVPTDMDWIWENGAYMAIWDENPNGFAWIVGPAFPDGIRVMKDEQSDVDFKNRLMFIVDSLGGQ